MDEYGHQREFANECVMYGPSTYEAVTILGGVMAVA